MEIKNLLLTAVLIIGQQLCFGQDAPSSKPFEPKPIEGFNIAPIQPYYVLKADDKSIGMFPTSLSENDFDLKSVDVDLVSKLEVIKGKDATDQYGALGLNGVIVVTFKSYASLPKELKDRFKDAE